MTTENRAKSPRVAYDSESDCAYITYREPGAAAPIPAAGKKRVRTVPLQIAPEGIFGSLNIDVDGEGDIVGIEVLGVSTIWPDIANGST